MASGDLMTLVLNVAPGLCFFAAFVLLLWRSRPALGTAAVLFLSGMFVMVGRYVHFCWVIVHLGTARSGILNTPTLLSLVGPCCALIYALIAATLLWPSIPQEKALSFGRVLHLVVAIPLAILLASRLSPDFHYSFDLSWLVFALLWFRIRESYAGVSDGSRNLQSAAHEE
jgi:hypothetical protein